MTSKRHYINRFALITMLTLFCSGIYAGEFFSSLKSVMKNDASNEAYIASSYPHNVEPYQDQLNKLWDATDKIYNVDSYNQQWKLVDLKILEEVVGHFPTEYILVSPVWKREVINENTSRNVVQNFNATLVKVNKAALFKWGCDDSVIPVLNIGAWPEGADDWQPVAVSRLGKTTLPIVSELDTSSVPKALLTNSIENIVGLSLNWPKENISANLLYDSGVLYRLFSVGNSMSFFTYLESKTPFDVRC